MSSPSPETKPPAITSSDVKPKTPYIFLSHDTRDADLAEAFAKLLSSVTAGVLKCFRSSDKRGVQGIEYGVEWFPELMKRLQEASDVVCLLTENSVNRPWILFEAGVAKGKLDTPILGLALGVALSTVNTGPFAQFQNSDDEDDSLVKLVMQLVRKIPGAEPDESVVKMQVQSFKAKCTECLKRKVEKPKESKRDADESTTVAKLFEEIKVMFNDLPGRLEVTTHMPIRRRRNRRVSPEIIEEILYLSKRSNPEVAFAILLSLIRDDYLFVSDLGRELVAASRTSNEENLNRALYIFHEGVEMAFRNPALRELMPDASGAEHIMHFLHRSAEEFVESVRRRKPSS